MQKLSVFNKLRKIETLAAKNEVKWIKRIAVTEEKIIIYCQWPSFGKKSTQVITEIKNLAASWKTPIVFEKNFQEKLHALSQAFVEAVRDSLPILQQMQKLGFQDNQSNENPSKAKQVMPEYPVV